MNGGSSLVLFNLFGSHILSFTSASQVPDTVCCPEDTVERNTGLNLLSHEAYILIWGDK